MSNNNNVTHGLIAGFFVLIILVVLVLVTIITTKEAVLNEHEKQDSIKYRIEMLEQRINALERRN